jgi:hypothetical protein
VLKKMSDERLDPEPNPKRTGSVTLRRYLSDESEGIDCKNQKKDWRAMSYDRIVNGRSPKQNLSMTVGVLLI